MIESIQEYLQQNPTVNLAAVGLLILVSYLIGNRLIARLVYALASRTDFKYDDIIVLRIRPRRLSLIVPLLLISYFSDLLPNSEIFIQKAVLFVALWLGIVTINALLDAFNEIYEGREEFTGEAIAGYLDVVKILAFSVGVILSISIITGQPAAGLLTGLGAITAVLMLIFQDTILSLVASFQISANDLAKEGDWLEVPAFDADGDVIDISLHQIKIQNWDKTISVVPTHKMLNTAYRNWRGMSESGGRRIKRAINIDLGTVRFCDNEMLENFRRFELVRAHIDNEMADLGHENSVDSRGLTNVGIFRAYIIEYLRNHPRVRTDMTLLVRQLAPGPTGLPIEVYMFTNTTVWTEYEDIQADIFDHLLAIVPQFGLRVFQEPTGEDFESLVRSA